MRVFCHNGELMVASENKQKKSRPSGMQNRIPSGEAASGSDGLFEAVIAYHETCPGGFSGKRNDKQHVIAINERE